MASALGDLAKVEFTYHKSSCPYIWKTDSESALFTWTKYDIIYLNHLTVAKIFHEVFNKS